MTFAFDAHRFAELTAVAAIVGSPNAYKASPTVVSWEAALPGDCTELTAEAERIFRALGWPGDIMERWTCKTQKGKRHAVLVLKLEAGATAIDCRHSRPMLKDDLHYRNWARAG